MKELFDKYKNYEDKKLVLLLLTDINCIIKKKYSEYLYTFRKQRKEAVLGENSMNLGIDFGSTYTIA